MFSRKHICFTTYAAAVKLFAAVAVFAVVLNIAPASAQHTAYLASLGSDGNPCTAAAPCKTIIEAAASVGNFGEILCLDHSAAVGGLTFDIDMQLTIDCSGVASTGTGGFTFTGLGGAFQAVTIRNLTMSGQNGGTSAVKIIGTGTLVLENCTIEYLPSGTAIDIEPTGPLSLVMINTKLSNNNSSGILLKPGHGGSVIATLDHVSITNSAGGGIKTDTTNGAVTLDIADSVISKNGGNGINAVGGASQNLVSIKNSVIAKNGAAGVQANGANAAVLLQTTLLDQNAAGATSVVSGGNMFTYGNNSIVGSAGSGFNHAAGLQ